ATARRARRAGFSRSRRERTRRPASRAICPRADLFWLARWFPVLAWSVSRRHPWLLDGGAVADAAAAHTPFIECWRAGNDPRGLILPIEEVQPRQRARRGTAADKSATGTGTTGSGAHDEQAANPIDLVQPRGTATQALRMPRSFMSCAAASAMNRGRAAR